MTRYDHRDLSSFSHRDLSDLRASRSRSLSRGHGLSAGRDLSVGDLSRGRGRIRSLSEGDAGEREAIMALTRRDADSIAREAVRDTDSFLAKRRAKCETPINPILAAIEVGGAAWLSGYLAQRWRGWRGSGALLPVGIVAGLLGHVAAYYDVFGGANHIRNISNGAIGGAVGIWAAGIGSLANENVHTPNAPNTGLLGALQTPNPPTPARAANFAPPPPSPRAPVYAYPATPPQTVPTAQPHMAPTVADYQNLSRRFGRRAA